MDHVPTRILLDTCVINALLEHGGFIFEGESSEQYLGDGPLLADIRALQFVMRVNERAGFQLKTSPLSLAEIANQQTFESMLPNIKWALDLIDHWLITLDESGDRARHGGDVVHRFKLSAELQELESRLMQIPDLRRDPLDRLLIIESRMARCDALLTMDRRTLWRHRERIAAEGINVITPRQLMDTLEPFVGLWA